MTAKTEATTLTRDQVKEQIRTWFASGLPEGQIMFATPIPDLVYVKLPDPNGVTVWAVALGVQVSIAHGSVFVAACYPLDLGGWALDVSCDEPVVQPQQRIEVTQ